MKRTAVNMVIDTAALVAFALLMSTGLLLRYQLPPGSGDPTHGGLGRGAQNRPITLLWGYSRHDWGDLHYWIALALVGILLAHVVLHWKWVVCVARGRQTDASGARLGIGLASSIVFVLLASLPLLSETQRVPRSELRPNGIDTQREGETTEFPPEHQGRGGGRGSSRGSMTLREVSELYQVPMSFIVEEFGLPEDVSGDERLGRLGQQYGFRMSDLRHALERPDGS